ncbi:MAG: DUF1593 domain-containing protein [Caldilineaceae bacterium]|nr:DUF1593 domain-containing protein [Caldilineaceae bacterium]
MNAFPETEKHRVVVLTDIGGDVDDMQSLTRFLLYADQYDIEGLLATSIRIFPNEPHRPLDGEPQPHFIVEWVQAYGQVRENLMQHSQGWPETEALLRMIKKGTKTGRNADFDIRKGIALTPDAHLPLDEVLGEGKDTDASQHLIDVVDRDDPRPVWVVVWGGVIELAQALWRVRNERSEADVAKFVAKLRVYAWGHQDAAGLWMLENFPTIPYLVSTGGILYSADPNLRSQEWLDTNVRFGHGPLGALCPLRKGELGGADSETYLGLIPNGLSVPDRPDWGGWGGRLKLAPGSETQWIDVDPDPTRETMGATISRWAPHFQNDYEARMDWCVKPFDEANHPPQPVLNGDTSLRPVEISAQPGERVTLDATGSSDVDNDALTYEWKFYPEAGSYSGQINIPNANAMTTSFIVPKDASGTVLHILLILTDDGSPRLTRYRRLVIQCQ